MDQQADEFDPYGDWFDIPAELRPPTHYQLLGVDDFESDLELIAQAAKQRSTYLHKIAAGPHRKIVQQLMGEVAIARRTLMNAEYKEAYDQELLADLEDHEDTSAAPIATNRAGKATKTADGKPTRTRRRQKSAWDEYKLHAASASILLLIVGIIWFVNRGSGERRAAEAGAAKSSPVVAAKSAPSAAGRNTTKRKASAQPSAAQQRRSPVRAKPTTSSRSGRPSLAPSFAVESFLTKDAPGMSKAKAAEKVSNKVWSEPIDLAADWQPQIPVVDDFTKKLKDRYQINRKTACTLKGERVVIEKADSSKYGTLRHKSRKLKAGEAVAIDTNLAPGIERVVQVGLAIGDARISLNANKDRLEVRTKHGKAKDTSTIGRLTSGSQPTTLIVLRSKENPERLHWIARVGENALTGQVVDSSLTAQVSIGIVFTAPDQGMKKPIWLDNLRVGKFGNAPEWKSTEAFVLSKP